MLADRGFLLFRPFVSQKIIHKLIVDIMNNRSGKQKSLPRAVIMPTQTCRTNALCKLHAQAVDIRAFSGGKIKRKLLFRC